MAVNKRLLQGAAAAGGLVPSEHFGVVLYEGDGSSSHSINGGKFGAGGYFNGSSGKIATSYISSSDYALSAWIKTDSPSTAQDIIGTNLGTDNSGGATIQILNSKPRIIVSGTTTWAYVTQNNSTTVDTNWHHILITGNNSGAKIYYDGSLIESTGSISGKTSTTNLQIGYCGNAYFKGKIDQVRVFTKELSSSEVSTLYAETASTVTSLDPLSEDTTDTLQVLGDSSCIATYRFENDEVDLSGNYNGTGTEIQYAAGRYGQAASFNGSSSFVDTGVDLSSLTNYSISLWINASSGDMLFAGTLASGSGGNNGIYLRYTSSNQFRFTERNTTSTVSDITTSNTYARSLWHHLVAIKDGSTNRLFINGSADGTVSNGTFNHTTDFTLGRAGGRTTELLNGEIDQVRIFNKALSASEVTTLYQENSLVASYRFEGNANDDMRAYDGTATNVSYEYGLNFTPDFVWIAKRNISNYSHPLFDSSRGLSQPQAVYSDRTLQESNDGMVSFDTGGFTVNDTGNINRNNDTFVAWCLKANGGTTSSNTDGTITSTVQANTAAGFSIVTWTGNGSAGATVGHGLGVAPDYIILKNRTRAGYGWYVLTSTGATHNMVLNTTDGQATSTAAWDDTQPTSTVFSLGWDTGPNSANYPYVGYCFSNIDGFSKAGTYTGNGSANGPIVETGFEPAFIMIKSTAGGQDWRLYDNKRNASNPRNCYLSANNSNAEECQYDQVDFLSNGFKVIGTDGSLNGNGITITYLAFAADPDTEQPTLASSFDIQTYNMTGGSDYDLSFAFKPQFVITKTRDEAAHWSWGDIIRGNNSNLSSNDTNAVNTSNQWRVKDWYAGATSVTIAQHASTSTSNVSYAWKADDNEPTINTEGSIDSLVSANANAGFSVVKYVGNGSSGSTIGHGLSAAPELIIAKNLQNTTAWGVYVKYNVGSSNNPASERLTLQTSDATTTTTVYWGGTEPTSSVFTVGTENAVNQSGYNTIAYCFHSVAGYSKIGSYTGTGSEQLITTGFAVDFVLIKSSTAAQSWMMYDSVRSGENYIEANSSAAEGDAGTNLVSFESNGFKVYTSNSENQSGQTFIYAAFKMN